MNSPVRFSPVNRRNLENTNTIVRTDWNETKRCVILSLSLSLVSFFSSLPFFLPFSFPFKFAEIAYWKPENWTGTLAIFHTCRAISPPFPPSPRSVAVRTIIAAWIIAESNNKRPWSPPLPTGLLRDLTFVQRNGRDYELFTPPSLPPSFRNLARDSKTEEAEVYTIRLPRNSWRYFILWWGRKNCGRILYNFV